MAKIRARFSTPGGRAFRGKVIFSPMANLVLGARGDRVNILVGNFEAPLDSSGYFAVDVPPGKYSVQFKIDNPEPGQKAQINDFLVNVSVDSSLADLIAPPAPVPAGAIRVSEQDLAHGVIA